MARSAELPALIRHRIEACIEVKKRLLQQSELLAQVAEHVIEAYKCGKKILLFGNGGSAADAQHIAAELLGKFYLNRQALPAEALTVNTSSLTAIANDYDFAQIFSRQLEALGNSGDVAVGISTSGNSANVVEGLCTAKRRGMTTVGLTGEDGGRLKAVADYCVCVPSRDTARIQEAHILIGHILCEFVEQALFSQHETPR